MSKRVYVFRIQCVVKYRHHFIEMLYTVNMVISKVKDSIFRNNKSIQILGKKLNLFVPTCPANWPGKYRCIKSDIILEMKRVLRNIYYCIGLENHPKP